MTETQRKALQAAEDAFRRYADHHAMNGDETKARANMALAGQMSDALAEPDHKFIYPGGGKELFQKLWLLTHNCVTSHAGNVVHTDKLPMQEMRAFLNHLCCLVDSPPAQVAPTQVPLLTADEKLQIALSCNMRIRTGSGAIKYATAIEQAVRQKAGLQ